MATMLRPKLEIGLGLAKLGLDKGLHDIKMGLDGLDKSVGNVTRNTNGLSRAFGGMLQSFTYIATRLSLFRLTQKIGGAFVELKNQLLDFDEQMRNVYSVTDHATISYDAFRDSLLRVAEDHRITDTPAVLAQGLYDIVSAGFEAADALTILQASAVAATAGLTTTQVSAGAIVGVLNTYGMGAEEATRVSNLLFQTVLDGVVTFPQLADAIGYVLPTAKALGITLEEVDAAYVSMTRQNIDANTASANLSGILTGLLKPTEAMTELLTANGYASGDALIQSLGFAGALQFLEKAMGGSATRAAELFGDVRALRGILALTNEDGKQYKEGLAGQAKAQEGAGATAKVLAEQMKSVRFQLRLLRKNLVVFFTEGLGDKFLSFLSGPLQFINHFFDSFFRARRRDKDFITSIFIAIRSAFLKAFGRETYAKIRPTLIAIETRVKVLIFVIRQFFRILGQFLRPFLGVIKWFMRFRKDGLNPVSAGFKALGTALHRFRSESRPLTRIVNDLGRVIAYLAQALHDFVSGNPSVGIKHLGDAFHFLWDAIKTGFAWFGKNLWKWWVNLIKAHPELLFGLGGFIVYNVAKGIYNHRKELWNTIKMVFHAIPWNTIRRDLENRLDKLGVRFHKLVRTALNYRKTLELKIEKITLKIKEWYLTEGKSLIDTVRDFISEKSNQIEDLGSQIGDDISRGIINQIELHSDDFADAFILAFAKIPFRLGVLIGEYGPYLAYWLIKGFVEYVIAHPGLIIKGLALMFLTAVIAVTAVFAIPIMLGLWFILGVVYGLYKGFKRWIWPWISDLVGRMVDRIMLDYHYLKDSGVALVETFWEGIQSMLVWLEINAHDLINRPYKAVQDLLGWMYAAGVDLVIGFWNGIASRTEWLKDQILGWAKSVIPDRLERFFGIGSPSKMMMEYGKNIVQGLALGMSDNKHLAKKAIDEVMQTMSGGTVTGTFSPRMSRAIAGGAAVGGGLGSTNFNGPVTVIANDPQEFARKMIQAKNRRRAGRSR